MPASRVAVQERPAASVAAAKSFASYPELDEFLDILKPLIREPAVVGHEDSFFGCISVL